MPYMDPMGMVWNDSFWQFFYGRLNFQRTTFGSTLIQVAQGNQLMSRWSNNTLVSCFFVAVVDSYSHTVYIYIYYIYKVDIEIQLGLCGDYFYFFKPRIQNPAIFFQVGCLFFFLSLLWRMIYPEHMLLFVSYTLQITMMIGLEVDIWQITVTIGFFGFVITPMVVLAGFDFRVNYRGRFLEGDVGKCG